MPEDEHFSCQSDLVRAMGIVDFYTEMSTGFFSGYLFSMFEKLSNRDVLLEAGVVDFRGGVGSSKFGPEMSSKIVSVTWDFVRDMWCHEIKYLMMIMDYLGQLSIYFKPYFSVE